MRRSTKAFLALSFLATCAAACAPSSPWPGGLDLEEHALAAAPVPVLPSFQLLEGTQDGILARHAAQRAATVAYDINMEDGQPAISSIGEDTGLVARVVPPTDEPLRQIVRLYRGDDEVFAADAGLPSPAVPLQALWAYDGHWALELLYSDADTWGGRLYVDGELVNAQRSYEEAFGFQLLDDRPFYFFQRGGVGFSYDGYEADLGYDEVVHYRCCAESTLNPVQAESMVAFFARREGGWYYVELGRFDS